jgi:hypothetical protein
MRRFLLLLGVFSLLTVGSMRCAMAQYTVFSDRATFEAGLGPVTAEDFTDSYHFPISSCILNTFTDEVVMYGSPIKLGDIKPGVTYSRPVGQSFFFNIDAGGGYEGGFLDGFHQPGDNPPLTVTFDGSVKGFGFNTNYLMGSRFVVDIFATGGLLGSVEVAVDQVISPVQFFGVISDEQNIVKAVITGFGDTTFRFALDNFTFSATGGGGGGPEVPEPGALALLTGAGTAGSLFLFRRRRR